MTITTVTPITSTNPLRDGTQTRAQFSQNMSARMAEIKILGNELVVSIPQMNTDINTVNTSAATSLAASNYRGEWAAQSGAAAVPYSVSRSKKVYGLKTALADVSTVEPEVTGGWATYWNIIYEPIAIVPISTTDASAAATVDITWPAGYKQVEIDLNNVIPATDATTFHMRTSTDGGSIFNSGGSDYAVQFRQMFDTGAISQASSASALFFNRSSETCGNAANENGFSGKVTIHKPDGAEYTRISFFLTYTNDVGQHGSVVGMARVNLASDVNAVRFYFSAGNIASGNFVATGLQAS
jgi:hypothetical protein